MAANTALHNHAPYSSDTACITRLWPQWQEMQRGGCLVLLGVDWRPAWIKAGIMAATSSAEEPVQTLFTGGALQAFTKPPGCMRLADRFRATTPAWRVGAWVVIRGA